MLLDYLQEVDDYRYFDPKMLRVTDRYCHFHTLVQIVGVMNGTQKVVGLGKF